MDTTLMQELFLQCLPSNVRMVLIPSAGELNLNQLAQLTDCIMEAYPPTSIAAIDTTNYSLLTAQVTNLNQHLDELTTRLSSAINTFLHCPHSPSPAK